MIELNEVKAFVSRSVVTWVSRDALLAAIIVSARFPCPAADWASAAEAVLCADCRSFTAFDKAVEKESAPGEGAAPGAADAGRLGSGGIAGIGAIGTVSCRS
ncbi:MAG: hypothetical protein JWO62_3149 [Acidimicrobiaceae bacterium]|nr:hypothetical protein [Acidimicrobiaceae bacterium]